MSSTSSPLRLTLIAAVTPSNGLGASGGLPWSLPSEMAYFRRATMHVPSDDEQGSSATAKRNAVIMGRNTWESIPPRFRPLKGRINVVISSSADAEGSRAKEMGVDAAQDAHLFASLQQALDYLKSRRTSSTAAQLARTFLIGGAQLYAQAMKELPSEDVLDRLLITRLRSPEYPCDVWLPEYRSEEQRGQEEAPAAGGSTADSAGSWTLAAHSELESWLGGTVAEGVQEEKGAAYTFQMWKQ